MAFRGEVDEGVDLLAAQQVFDPGLVADVTVHEAEVGVVPDRVEVVELARVGQGVQHHYAVIWVVFHPVVDKVAADEAGTAGDEEIAGGHAFILCSLSMERSWVRQWAGAVMPRACQVAVFSSTLRLGRRAGVG